MQRNQIGKSDVTVSEIILGCWVMGGAQWGGADDAESIRAIHAAKDAGIDTLDTAEVYNDGYSEEVIGKAIKGHAHEYVISSKVANNHMRAAEIKRACENSLKRLGRDYLDLYFLHWPAHFYGGEAVPLEESLTALAELQQAGKIKAVGLSNFSQADFEAAGKVLRIDAYQPPFSLLWRRPAEELFDYCIAQDIAVVPYSPLGQGLLSGKFRMDTEFKGDDIRPGTPLFQPENRSRALALVEELRPIAQKYGKTPAQLAIRWVMQFPGVTAPIVGGRTAKQVGENAGAAGWSISDEDFAAMDKLSRDFWQQMPHYNHFFDLTIT